jgi:hypothetical protein
MLGYQIENGRLYRIGDGKSTCVRPHLECVTQEEAVELARIEHENGGHFGRDLIKISLFDHICSPWLDKSIMTAIVKCGRCKGFGGSHLVALLEPITRRHPWELMVGDYMSMPLGKGGFHTIGLFMDVYSQKIFGFKFTTYGSTVTTIASLNRIRQMYRMPEVFMAIRTSQGLQWGNGALSITRNINRLQLTHHGLTDYLRNQWEVAVSLEKTMCAKFGQGWMGENHQVQRLTSSLARPL